MSLKTNLILLFIVLALLIWMLLNRPHHEGFSTQKTEPIPSSQRQPLPSPQE